MKYQLVKVKVCTNSYHCGGYKTPIGKNYATLNAVFGAMERYHYIAGCGCQVEVREQE